MKQKFLLIFSVLSLGAWAQVGINTDSPQATLHIATDPALGAASHLNGGLILEYPGTDNTTLGSDPLTSLNRMQFDNFLVQNGNPESPDFGKVNYMSRYGLTYMPARPSTLGTVNQYDHTILVQADFALPGLPEAANLISKIVTLTYSSSPGTSYNITGPMQWGGTVVTSLPINRASSSYTMQFNGTRWIVIDAAQAGSHGSIRTMSTGTVGMTDGTILVTGSVNLPAANLYPGREFRFVYHGGTASVISPNDFILSGSTIGTNYGLNTGENGKGITVQSNGTNWIVVSRF